MRNFNTVFIFSLSLFVCSSSILSQSARTRGLPDPYYPQKPKGELRLNYYYDRTGRWVKFSDWIPFQQRKYSPRFFEDFYQLYGLPANYKTVEVKEGIYYLYHALSHRFRHPENALCNITTEAEYHKYRLLMTMKVNLLIMRMYMRLGSLYDKRHLYFHDLDVADDLEISFLISRTYYKEAFTYWNRAKKLALQADRYPFELDLPTIESDRYEIAKGRLNFERIIGLHLERLEAKLGIAGEFLKQEGRPRPVKKKMHKDIEQMYDDSFTPDPLDPPVLNPEWNEKPLFPKDALFPEDEAKI